MTTLKIAHKDFVLAPHVGGAFAWLETTLLTTLVLVFGYGLRPHDPLLVEAGFPWSMLAPLLLALRYGFLCGLASVGLLLLALLAYRWQGLAYAEPVPAWIVGCLFCAMLAGEFRDLWARRLQRLDMAGRYRQYRLDEFTRAHQVLRISHDLLEQRVAGDDQSLRSRLLGLRARLRLPQGADALATLAEPILNLLGQHGSLHAAAIYRIDDGWPVNPPLAQLGEMPALDPRDPLLCASVAQRQLASVREMLSGGDQPVPPSPLVISLPLVNTGGEVVALVAVRQIAFFAFNQRTFSQLMLLAGHIADLLQVDAQTLQLQGEEAQHFSQQLRRSVRDAIEHGLPACLYAFELSDGIDETLLQLLQESRRGLDLQLRLRNQRDHDCLLVLMPLTSAQGLQGYQQRLRQLFVERFGFDRQLDRQGLRALLGVRAMHHILSGDTPACGVRRFLLDECALDARDCVV